MKKPEEKNKQRFYQNYDKILSSDMSIKVERFCSDIDLTIGCIAFCFRNVNVNVMVLLIYQF